MLDIYHYNNKIYYFYYYPIVHKNRCELYVIDMDTYERYRKILIRKNDIHKQAMEFIDRL